MKHSGLRKGILALTIAGLLLASGIYAYMYTQSYALADAVVSDRALLKNSETSRLQGKDIVTLADATSAERAKLPAFFIPAESGVEAIKAIESVGEVSGASVDISSINAADPDESSHMGRISAAVSIAGTWRQVTEAIALFETLPYDRTINQLSLRSVGGKDSRWQADFTLAVATLSRK